MKQDKTLCFVCGKAIARNPKPHYGKFTHPSCERTALKMIAQAYEIQKAWEEVLDDKQKKVLKALQNSRDMTIFEISNTCEIELAEVRKILEFFRHKVQKIGTVKGGEIVFRYKYTPDLSKMLKERPNYK